MKARDFPGRGRQLKVLGGRLHAARHLYPPDALRERSSHDLGGGRLMHKSCGGLAAEFPQLSNDRRNVIASTPAELLFHDPPSRPTVRH